MGRILQKSVLLTSCTLIGAALPQLTLAHYVYSGDKCDHSLPIYHGPSGVCGNRPIPEGRNRNARGFVLECSADSDPHIRKRIHMPQDMFEKWRELDEESRNTGHEERFAVLNKMHELRLQEPKIEWTGIIAYSTVENWTWTSCEEHESAIHCGTHEDEKTCYRSVPAGKDSQGNTIYRDEPYTCTETHANSCHYDEDEHEAVACSNEVMDYHLEYAKPDSSWHPPRNDQELAAENQKPAHLRYHTMIPNKYDLLPGEVENIQTFDNASMSSVLSPTIKFGDAWNHYDFSISFEHGGAQASCVYGRRYKINAIVITKERDNTRVTPNAFRPPVDDQGNPKEPFEFQTAGDSNNKLKDVRPSMIRLVDSSNGALEMMAQQMRATSLQLEEAKKEKGLGKTGTTAKQDMADGVYTDKDTRIKVAVIEKNYAWGVDRFARDSHRMVNLYGGGDTLVTLDGKFYKMPLDEDHSRIYYGNGNWPFKGVVKHVSVQLKPNTNYLYLVSMYHQNIPFYAQKGQKNVKWREFFKGEDSYYSEPLVIPFKTPNIEQRGLLNWLLDY